VTYRSSKVDCTGSWSWDSGEHYAWTTRRGNSAELETTGRAMLYVAPKSSASGLVDVYVDGSFLGRFDLESKTEKYDRIIARANLVGSGAHQIRIVDASGNHVRTNLSDFVILR
jgi:hypothetical protein